MKSNDYSFTSLLEFCEFIKKTAGESEAKSSGRLTACRVVLKGLLPRELEDVRTIDVDRAADKYASTSSSNDKTVVAYRNRVKGAIELFVEHVDSLKDVQPKETTGESNKTFPPSEEKKINEPAQAKAKRYPKPPTVAVNTINVQIRSDFLAQLILPLDLKTAEADHLCKLIKALPMGQDGKVEESPTV
jgi:hypothetical protein